MSSSIEKKSLASELGPVPTHGEGTVQHVVLGYDNQLKKSRSFLTTLAMALAICAVPFGIGGTFMSAVLGGGQLSAFIGLIAVLVLDTAVALSLAELASRYPTSSGVYYWSWRLCDENSNFKKLISFITGWTWLIGNWTISLSVNFGFASLIAATVAIYYPGWEATDWQLLLIFYALCLLVFAICSFGDRILPYIDTAAAVWNFVTIIAVLLAVVIQAKEGRHSASFALTNYEWGFSGWGQGFTFFIGLLPPAYAFCALGKYTLFPAISIPS